MSERTARVHDPRTYTVGVPYDDLAALRREHGVVWVDEPPLLGAPGGSGYWLVLRHDDVQRVVSAPALFSSWEGGTQIRDPASPADLDFVRRMMLNMDPPEHTRLRKLVSSAFTPRAVRALEEQIAGHVHAIVDRMLGDADSGTCDFATDVAADLPLLLLAEVLGVPAEDRYLLYDWSNRVIGWQDPDYATSARFTGGGSELAEQALAVRPTPDESGRMPDPRSRAGMPDLYRYAHLLGEAKRAHPTGDVMSTLMAARDDAGGRLSVTEFENMFWLFAVAGNETLRNGLPGAMIALLTFPEVQNRLRADPSLMPRAVEELLRWWTPVMTFRRTALADTEVAGQPIAAGDKVVVSFVSANRDETVFADPDAFVISRWDRPVRGQHLTFGWGPHFCLGANLARTQMRLLFTELLARTSSIRAGGEPALLRSNFQRGVKRLPIAWERR